MVKDSALNERATAVEIGGLVDGVGTPVIRAGYALKAKPSWITLSAVEGTGNSQVDVTAPVYKGRNGRSGLITVAVEDLTEDVTLQQEGSTIWDVTTQSLAFVKTGEAEKFTGNSNLASITFAVDSNASSWSCVTKIDVICNSSCNWRNQRRNSLRTFASNAPNGSSNNSTRGLTAKARAKAIRWRCPPDNCDG